MPCRIYKLDFQEKKLNLDRDLNHGSNPGPGSNFSLENLISKSNLLRILNYLFIIAYSNEKYLLYGSETSITKPKHKNKLAVAVMDYPRYSA